MAGLVLAGAILALGLGARPEMVLAAVVLALLACGLTHRGTTRRKTGWSTQAHHH